MKFRCFVIVFSISFLMLNFDLSKHILSDVSCNLLLCVCVRAIKMFMCFRDVLNMFSVEVLIM